MVGCGGGGVSLESGEVGGSVLITESLSSSESCPIRSCMKRGNSQGSTQYILTHTGIMARMNYCF